MEELSEIGVQKARACEASLDHSLLPSLRFYPALNEAIAAKSPVVKVRSETDEQFGVDMGLRWNETGLVCDFKVHDPTPEPVQDGDLMWLFDSVQIGIDPHPERTAAGSIYSAFYELGFAVKEDGSVIHHCWKITDGNEIDFSKVRMTGSRIEGGYTLNILFPWQSLNIDPKKIPEFLRMNVTVNDKNHMQGDRRYVQWTSGIADKKDANSFAKVFLIRKDSAAGVGSLEIDSRSYDAEENVPVTYVEYAVRDLPGEPLALSVEEPSRQKGSLLQTSLPEVKAGMFRTVPMIVWAGKFPHDGMYTLSVKTGDKPGPIATESLARVNIKAQVQSGLKDAESRLKKLKERLRSDTKASGDAYVQLGLTIADRFIDRLQRGGPEGKKTINWPLLQVRELSWVLDQTQERADALASKDLSAYSLPERPAGCLNGYGHFGEAVRMIPDWRKFGATLIATDIGPNSLKADGTNDINILPILQQAARYGIKVDLLLSPHYFPDWALAQAPDLKPIARPGFIEYNIDHPKAREVIQKWLETIVPMVKDEPALFSLNLSNEPVYSNSGRDPYSRPLWTQYLKDRHPTIESLNSLYGTKYKTFEDVPVPPVDMPKNVSECRAYYDWIVFNQAHFADWHRWMNDIIKKIAPKVRTNSKVMGHIFARSSLHFGLDPERICEITDWAGNDCWAYLSPGSQYSYDWQLEEAWYDLLHSFRQQPVFNSENHIIPDGDPAVSIPPGHTRSLLWQGGLHHMRASAIWVWEEPTCPAFEGSIFIRPANIYSAGQAMLDMNRLADEVDAISNTQPQIALLYSIPSIFWEKDYSDVLKRAYTACVFSGQPMTFISERQLSAGKYNPVKWIVLPHATHLTDSALNGLVKFVQNGGKIICLGDDCLAWNEYHQSRKLPDVLKTCSRLSSAGDNPTFAAELRKSLISVGLKPVIELSEKGLPAWGVEYRVVREKNRTLVSMINFLPRSKTVNLAIKGKAIDLLHNNHPVKLEAIQLEPMVPVLLEVRP